MLQVFDSPHLPVLVSKRVRRRLDAKSIVQLLRSVDAPIGIRVFFFFLYSLSSTHPHPHKKYIYIYILFFKWPDLSTEVQLTALSSICYSIPLSFWHLTRSFLFNLNLVSSSPLCWYILMRRYMLFSFLMLLYFVSSHAVQHLERCLAFIHWFLKQSSSDILIWMLSCYKFLSLFLINQLFLFFRNYCIYRTINPISTGWKTGFSL